MSFSKGDKVLIDYMGSPYNKAEGIVVGRNENGMWLVSIDNDTPEPKWVEFTGHHLQLLEAAESTKPIKKPPYQEAVERLIDRQIKKGIDKYGVTLDENKTLTAAQRIEHLEEELADGLMYCEHLKASLQSTGITADDYQRAALRTARADELSKDDLLLNGVMGLCGEAGECIDLVKKVRFQGHGLDYLELQKELGDVAWYLAIAAWGAGFDLSEVLEENIEKLKKRYPEGFSKERSINRAENKTEERNSENV